MEWVAVPIMAFMIPISAIWSSHRLKLAQLKYSRPLHDTEEVAALRREVKELKEMVHTQMLALDLYSNSRSSARSGDPIQERISVREG
jgi:hypothetical protein